MAFSCKWCLPVLLLAGVARPEVALAQDCPEIRSAIISTAGGGSALGQLSQTFEVAPGYGVLEGRVRFVSNEWPAYFGSQYNDSYLVRLTTAAGSTILVSGNLNSSSWTSADTGEFNGHSVEETFSVDVSEFTGDPISLHFEVRDVGDFAFDSGLAIADVRFVRTERYRTLSRGRLVGNGRIGPLQGGQGIRIVVENGNVLGAPITIFDNSFDRFQRSRAAILLPLGTHTFQFSRFGPEPMPWDFDVRTEAEVLEATYEVQSTWVPGQPPNPCR